MSMSMSPSEAKTKTTTAETASAGLAETKRMRRSAIEKKSRQRRTAVLERMRAEVKQLESLHTAMLERRKIALGALGEERYETSRLASAQDVQRNYSDLSLVAHALEEDGVVLQKALQKYRAFQREAVALLAERGSEYSQLSDKSMSPNVEQVYDSGMPPSSSFSAKFKPLTIPQCYAFVRDTCAAVRRFDESGDFVSTGASFMGWRDRRKYDPKTQKLQYGLRKTFRTEKSAEDLIMRTWNNNRDPVRFAEMYYIPNARMRREIVQTMGDDLYIVRMYTMRPNTSYTTVTVQMAFRVQTPTGFTLIVRTVPSPEIKNALEPHEYFYGLFHWSHYNQIYDESGVPSGTEIVVGGCVDHVVQQVSKSLLFEVLLNTMRWESYTVAPLFLKEA